MDFYQINQAIMNVTSKYGYNEGYINLVNQNNQRIIDINNIYKDVATSLPEGVLTLLYIGITLLLLYYYILPIWDKYLIEYTEYVELVLKGGLIFIVFSILYLMFYTYTKTKFYKVTLLFIIVFMLLYWGSKWLMKHKKQSTI